MYLLLIEMCNILKLSKMDLKSHFTQDRQYAAVTNVENVLSGGVKIQRKFSVPR